LQGVHTVFYADDDTQTDPSIVTLVLMDWISWLLTVLRRPIEVSTTVVQNRSDWERWLAVATGVGALLAALFAGVGAWIAIKTWRTSEETRIKTEERERRAQATRVVSTVLAKRDEGDDDRYRAWATVHNSSDLPIRDVLVITSDVATGEYDSATVRTIPPDARVELEGLLFDRRTPEEIISKFSEGVFGTDNFYGTFARVATHFTDANDVAWLRDDDGNLQEFAQPAGADGMTNEQAVAMLRALM
jgi:hypothetical protein